MSSELYEKRDDSEQDPFFNMAKRTLECLDIIKKEMLKNDLYNKDTSEKQKNSIELLKKFYMFSIPLFSFKEDDDSNDSLENLEKEILLLELQKKSHVKSGNQGIKYIYSKEVENKINELFIKMSKLLKPYLMPIKRDDDGL